MIRGFAVVRNGMITHDGRKLNIFRTVEDAVKEKTSMERWIIQREEIRYSVQEVDLALIDVESLTGNAVQVRGFGQGVRV